MHGWERQSADTNGHAQSPKQNVPQGNNTDNNDPQLPSGIPQAQVAPPSTPPDSIIVKNKGCEAGKAISGKIEGRRHTWSATIQLSMSHRIAVPLPVRGFSRGGCYAH